MSAKKMAKMVSKRIVFFYGALLIAVGFGIGFLVSYLVYGLDTSKTSSARATSQKLLDLIKATNIQQFHRNFTAKPHLAGTEGEKRIAEYIRDTWISQGLNAVRLVPYTILMSYPSVDDPNRITLYDENNTAIYVTQLVEKILRPEQNQSDVVPPFNVYSPPGHIQAPLVYVNYARVEDFKYLNETIKVDVTGKICIARYGKIFRADKVDLGEQNGCLAMVLYTDPADYAPDGVDTVYPDSWWLPGTGVQRGTVKKSDAGLGDPLTPMYPAIDSAFRLNVSEADLPRIPVHPIGYDDARVLLSHMTGPQVPAKWRGKLNVTYHIGPGFHNPLWKVEMHITTSSQMATTHNVIGFIEGQVEPDRYVIIGNHYDAFVFGAVDPNSGTAAMLEVSRAYGQLVKEGWRPRRTLVFCAWGAEEAGIIGSREWVENFGHIISDRAVAYLNIDSAVQGNYALRARSLPLLNQVIIDVTKMIPNPDEQEVKRGRKTVYDTWLARYATADKTRPKIPTLGSGSDFAPFVGGVGVTSVDIRYHFDESLNISSYPLYHSIYETSYMFESFMDPHFKYSLAVAQVWAELAYRLVDSPVLPFGVLDYADAVRGYLVQLEAGYGTLIASQGMNASLDYLRSAVDRLLTTADDFQHRLTTLDSSNELMVRQMNDQMMQMERAFIDPSGLPNRPAIRHVLFAPSIHNSYAGTTFPGLVDSLFGLDNSTDVAAWRMVEKQLSIITFFVESAANSLLKPTQI